VCCALSGDLAATLEKLSLQRATGDVPAFERVILETTGLADPAPVIQTILERSMVLCGYRLGSVLTTVDTVNASRTLERHSEARRQVAVADRLFLTKTDLADREKIDAVSRELRRLNPLAPIQMIAHGAIDPAWILAAEHDDVALPAPGRGRDGAFGHAAQPSTLVVRFDEPVPYAALSAWMGHLVGNHGERLLRVKGVVAVTEQRQPIAIHGVQHLFHPPRILNAWPAGVSSSTIVMILDGVDPGAIRSSAPDYGLQPA
jgi:G3E family GTPase